MSIQIGNFSITNESPLFFIAGPCVLEDDIMALEVASELRSIAEDNNIFIIFKASYDKANRTSINSYRGPGIEKGIQTLARIKAESGLPVLSDIHTPDEVDKVKDVLDILQIPAFLCRQTDLLVSAAMTRKAVNIKKGQFLSPWDMKNAVEKIKHLGNNNILVTERGTMLGYNNLVVDMRSIPVMKSFGYPVIFDATHSVQLPGGTGNASGGQREYIRPLSMAAVAAGCNGVFMEVHPEPAKALSDGATQLPLKEVRDFIQDLSRLGSFIRSEK
ncbi:MAG: 3-deoxy-8-phosphooctulonate synthase [Nitrospirae bacterium]|nr:3-deoxy-8-phosphooctulonate synthase [Nitrospirota bacterium]